MVWNKNSGYGQIIGQLPFSGSGKVFAVGDSGTANRTMLAELFDNDADGVVRFFSTIDAAIGACTANAGDKIFVMPGHAETVATAGAITCDVAGVAIIGLGQGEDRPILTFDGSDATPSIVVSAANVKWDNMVFKCNEASLNHMFDVKGTDLTLENLAFREGTATPLFFVAADTVDADSNRLKIKNCQFYCPTAGNGDAAIHIAKDMVGVRIENVDIYGDWDLGGIYIPAGGNACLDLAIRDSRIVNLLTNVAAISINGTSCTGEIVNCRLGTDTKATALDNGGLRTHNVRWADTTDQVSDSPIFPEVDSASNVLGANDADNGFDSSTVADNRDGSVLERLETIIATLRDDVASNYIGLDDADNVAATTSVVANVDGTILERLEALMDPLAGYNPRLGFGVTKVSDLADGAGTDNLFTVTGRVLITSLTGEVTTVIGGAATLKLRDVTNSVDLCAATTIDTDAVGTMYALTSISTNILNGTGAVPVIGSIPNITGAQQLDVAIVGDAQAALTIAQVLDAADTGNVTWRLTYIPLTSGSTVTAAA